MPNENDPALNTVANIAQPHDAANAPAEQGPAPSELPPEPDLQPVQPGAKLSAAQLGALMGDGEAGGAHDLDAQESADHNTES